MFRLLSIIISYASLLILLMPPTSEDIISTAVLFVFGICLIIYAKLHKTPFVKNKQYFLIAAAVLITAFLSPKFYNQWLPSSKMMAIAAIIHMPVEAMLFIGALMLSVLSLYFICIGLQFIISKVHDSYKQNNLTRSFLFFIPASFLTVISSQVMIHAGILSMGCPKLIWNILVVLTVILVFYCLLGKIMPAVFIGTGIFMIISTVNVYVYRFRQRLFEPLDIFSIGTAKNVAGSYSLFPIPFRLIVCWSIYIVMLMVFCRLLQKRQVKLTTKLKCALLGACAACSAAIFFFSATIPISHWYRDAAGYNGYILNFTAGFRELSVKKPDNYSTELITELAEQYKTESDEQEIDTSELPHIIVIMDETFSDLSVAGEFSTNIEVMPFISSLKDNTVSGYALSSVYGGNTANSEYEFLTGNSMAWLSPNAVPYQQYISAPAYSMVSYLKSSYNYKCIAMHPFRASGWNRPNVYEYLGFDECFFIDDFPSPHKFVREYISDREMFEFVIDTFEANKENSLFIFGVTMQNHNPYDYTGDNYTKYISLDDYDGMFPDVEQYLSLIHETDKAVEYLITYFKTVDEKVIIAFYGDHQPGISSTFYDAIDEAPDDTMPLDKQQKRYEVPFFVWANYDIEEEYISCTSLNYLSSYVYDAAEIALPPYNRFLRAMEGKIPAVNVNGFYSLTDERYLPFNEADGDELRLLELYEALQYNSIFDKKHRSETLFPTLN